MVRGWRRAFCTSIPTDGEPKIAVDPKQSSENAVPSPRLSSKFSFFSSGGSNPSTPRLSQPLQSPGLRCRTTSTAAEKVAEDSPKLQCKTSTKSSALFHSSNPSSPRSPSSLSLLKNTLRLSKSRCGICVQSVKTGQGTAIFTAECSHAFHFPCIAAHVKKQGSLVCPVCGCNWKEVPLLAIHKNMMIPENGEEKGTKNQRKQTSKTDVRIYDDDESLMSPTGGGRFNPIPESDENEEENGIEEFQGFFVNPTPPSSTKLAQEQKINSKNVDVRLLPDAAVVSVGRGYETYAVVLKVNAPETPAVVAARSNETSSLLNRSRRAPIDLVTVLDVGGSMTGAKLHMMKRAMRLVISSLCSTDRLSIVAFSATTKRMMPLLRMTPNGRRSARRIVDALVTGQGTSVGDALRKATKVLEDRREKNPVASIMLLSAGTDDRTSSDAGNPRRTSNPMASTRFAHLEIPAHSFGFGENGSYGQEPVEDAFAKCVKGLLSVVVQDLRLQIGFASGSAPAEITSVYSCTGRPTVLGSGSIRIGDLYAEEERELLVELKVPTSAIRAHHVLSVRSSFRDPSTQELIHVKEQALLIPRPHAVRSSAPNIERLRNFFITTRAVAESRRLIELNDFSSAHQLLSSARGLLMQSSSSTAEDYVTGLEAELSELSWRRQHRRRDSERDVQVLASVDQKSEPLTPTSAWRAAERLAKVAIMRKSMNRVGDLHGFENARF